MTLTRKIKLKRKVTLVKKRLKESKPFKKTSPRAILAQRKAIRRKLT